MTMKYLPHTGGRGPGLFDGVPTAASLSVKVAAECPDWFNLSKNTPRSHIRNVDLGRHPFGLPLHSDPEKHCSDCREAYRPHNIGPYWKCRMVRKQTCGTGTDLRLKWRACIAFEEMDGDGKRDGEGDKPRGVGIHSTERDSGGA